MKKNVLSGITLSVLLLGSCAVNKNTTTISPYDASQPVGQSALVYALPQTRLYFDVDMVRTIVKKGPYAEYATRMLGLQNVPMKDSESWQVKSIRINNNREPDSKQLYTLSFIDYPSNIDKLLRFTKEGVILDVTVGNVLTNSRSTESNNDDFQFINTAIRTTTTEKVDTFYKTILTDTAFVRIPVLQRKVLGKTTEEQAREAAAQIFGIRQSRLDVLTGNIDHPVDGTALKLILQSLNIQEEQLLSLFNGAKIESRHSKSYSVLPDRSSTSGILFYFSDRVGAVSKNTAGAKEVWYEIGQIPAAASATLNRQTNNIIYYRIPQVAEVSAGVEKNTMATEQVTVCQFGNMVSFPLIAPTK